MVPRRPKKPPHSRRCRQLPSIGAKKHLLEERRHEVTEWQKSITSQKIFRRFTGKFFKRFIKRGIIIKPTFIAKPHNIRTFGKHLFRLSDFSCIHKFFYCNTGLFFKCMAHIILINKKFLC